MHPRITRSIAAIVLAVALNNASAADKAMPNLQPAVKNLADQKFDTWPDVPACIVGTVLDGDPAKGPSLLLIKLKSGCVAPWHWHTPNERVMLASGTARMEMRGAKPVTLKSGGYAMMPSHHVHRFTCVSSCVMFLSADGIFDTHYVDAADKEIPAAKALARKK